jgi:hypothetical protein
LATGIVGRQSPAYDGAMLAFLPQVDCLLPSGSISCVLAGCALATVFSTVSKRRKPSQPDEIYRGG